MFSLHKKKRIMLSALTTMAIILPAVVFAANRLMVVDDTHAITYEMPEGYTAMVDPNFYDCVVAAYKSTYPAAIIPETGITDEQLSTIDQLVCNSRADGKKIVDTTGLEKMPRMAYLDLSSNNISAIDISDFNLLSYLNLHSNQLNAINVSNNSALTNLYLNNNNISTIDLTHNPGLKEIDISNNRLDSINLSNNVKLVYAKLHANQLSSIDVSNNTALRLLNINDNNIPLIDISNNTNLNDFMADDIIVFYTGINPTISNGNFIYDMSGLNFLKDGDHEGFIVDFSIANTENYSYDEANMILTVNNPEGAGRYIQVSGVDDRNEGSFTYKLGLPYVLRYDLNGGSGNFGPAVCYPSISTQTCTIDIADGSPVLTDYNFIGWADTDDATAGEYGAGDTISLSNNQTIYAVWKSDITTVNLDFDLNGGEGEISAQSCSFTSANPNCTVTIPNVTPTRAGYNFLGWANSDTATVADYQQGGSMSLSQDKTVYAVWELITNTVSLSFNLNGGEGDVATQTCTVDINNPTCDATIPSVDPTRNGYNFIGWAESDTATSAAYNSGDNVTINSNKTLYAVWQIITTTISLSFDLNGGEGDVANQTCTLDIVHPNCMVTIPNTTPTRVGYNFLGWANSDTATVAVYQSGGSISLSQDKTVYAVWEMIVTTIKLDFDLNGGEGEIATQTCTLDIDHVTCDVTIPATVPTRNGYNFMGWAESDAATEPTYHEGDSLTINNDKTIFAVWDMVNTTITLNYDLNGGEGEIAAETCVVNVTNPTCEIAISDVIPTKEDHEFLGWADSASATEAAYVSEDEITINADKTLYAVWKNTRDEEPDDSETPVPDTSAPDTGVNTNNGVDAVIAISLLPVLVGIIYIANRQYKKTV